MWFCAGPTYDMVPSAYIGTWTIRRNHNQNNSTCDVTSIASKRQHQTLHRLLTYHYHAGCPMLSTVSRLRPFQLSPGILNARQSWLRGRCVGRSRGRIRVSADCMDDRMDESVLSRAHNSIRARLRTQLPRPRRHLHNHAQAHYERATSSGLRSEQRSE